MEESAENLHDHASAQAGSREPARGAVARCRARWASRRGNVIVGLSGDATWRGRPVREQELESVMEQMVAAYLTSKSQLLGELSGPFALAVLEPAVQRALLAVDRMGIEKLTYSKTGSDLVFGTSAALVDKCAPHPRTIRDQALYDFLIFHMVPGPQTVFQNVAKLPPATALEMNGQDVNFYRYWTPTYEYVGQRDSAALGIDLNELLAASIRSSGIEEQSGAFLSGGLDSSSIAGKLAEAADSPAKTFTVGFGEDEYDERRYARITNRHFGCESFEYDLQPNDIVEAIPIIAAAYDEPFGNSSAVPTYFCAKMAADNGVRHLLAGDGGDEIFGGNERYVRHRIFEIYKRIPRWLRSHFIDLVAARVSSDSKVTVLRKFRSYVDQANIPLPERFESWNLTFRAGSEQMLDPEFRASIDELEPGRIMREVWNNSPSEDLLEQMLWYDWHFTLAYNDLRKVGTMCELAGVRVSYPLLDQSIVELAARVPPELKIAGHQLRSFFKNAMSGFLPDEILTKSKHGFGLPFGQWLKSNRDLADFVYSHLEGLKKRTVIRVDFIDELIQSHRSGHASYYGYAIWDLVMLEAWLMAHADEWANGG